MRAKLLALLGLLLVVSASALTWAGAKERPRLYDSQVARIHSGTALIDVSALDWTGYQPLLTIAPTSGHALYDGIVTFDLDSNTGSATGFATGYTSETIRFAVGRKIMGSWRIDTEKQSATVAGTAAGSRSVTLDLGIVGPTEQVRIYVLVSTEQTDVNVPYVLSYRAPSDATLTDAE